MTGGLVTDEGNDEETKETLLRRNYERDVIVTYYITQFEKNRRFFIPPR